MGSPCLELLADVIRRMSRADVLVATSCEPVVVSVEEIDLSDVQFCVGVGPSYIITIIAPQ